MVDLTTIKIITENLKKIIEGETETIIEKLNEHEIESPEILELFKQIKLLVLKQTEACDFAKALSAGNLNIKAPKGIKFIEPIVSLKNNLQRLILQINHFTAGDYDQQIDFWGDLSLSFNKLREVLKDRQHLEEALSESEKKYRLIAENSFDVIGIVDIETLALKYVSPSVRHLLGYSAEEMINKTIGQVFTNESYIKVTDDIKEARKELEEGTYAGSCKEYQIIRLDNTIIDTEISFTIIKDENGKPKELIGTVRDITRRKHAELLLQGSQLKLEKLLASQTKSNKKLSRQLNYIFEHTTNAIAFFEIKDKNTSFLMCNNKWANALGFDSQKITGLKIEQVCDDETTKLHQKYINWITRENRPLEDVFFWKDKQLELQIIPVKDDHGILVGCAAFISDITEKQEAIHRLQTLEKQLAFTGITVETRERRKLASDLHDNVGPLLSSMNMYLSSLSRKPEVQKYSGLIQDVRRILKETISTVREISNNISPQILNTFGLTAALNLFFDSMKNLIDIKIENNIGDFRFSETKEVMLYNIIKEAFNNSIKYANASRIEVHLKKIENIITLVYSDNGIGFNLEEKMALASKSLGLFSMINRIKNLNGVYKIKTSPGNGFYLEVNFLTEF